MDGWTDPTAEQRAGAEQVAAQLREVEPRPAFVLQVGDYVHGDCPTAETSLEHYDDFVRSIRRHALPVPLFLARGNHELQGQGVRAVDVRTVARGAGQESNV